MTDLVTRLRDSEARDCCSSRTEAADELERLQKELAECRKDAARYRWLRLRLEVRNMSALSGGSRPAISTRIGHCFFDTDTVPGRGYLNQGTFKKECEELDEAIDAAMKQE